VKDNPQRIPVKAWGIVFVFAFFLISFSVVMFRHSEKKSTGETQSFGSVPDFHFTTQDGKPFSKADLLGKVWIVDFFFTSCPGPCPIMSSRLSEVYRELKRADDVRLVSVSIDPEHDSPQVLSEYASRFEAKSDRWIFLTGPKSEITEFTTRGMLQALATDSSGIPTHSTRFLIIDRNGEIRKIRHLDEPELVQKLLMDIGDLLRESSIGKASKSN